MCKRNKILNKEDEENLETWASEWEREHKAHRTLAECYGCCYWLLCGRCRGRRRIGHNAWWFPCISEDNTSILINLSEACKSFVVSLLVFVLMCLCCRCHQHDYHYHCVRRCLCCPMNSLISGFAFILMYFSLQFLFWHWISINLSSATIL